MVDPQNYGFQYENGLIWMIWGYHHFRKPAYGYMIWGPIYSMVWLSGGDASLAQTLLLCGQVFETGTDNPWQAKFGPLKLTFWPFLTVLRLSQWDWQMRMTWSVKMPPNCPQSLQPSWAVQLSLEHHGAPVLESFNLCSLVHHVSIVICIVLQWETIVWKQDETSTRLVPREQWLIASLQVTFIPCQELQVNEGFGRKVPESAPFSAPYADQTTEDGNQTFGWPPNWVCRSKQTHCNSVKRCVVATCKWDQMSVSYVSDTLSRDVTWFGVSNTHKHIM